MKKLFKYIKNSSIARKNVFILLITLLPFVAGMIITIFNSSDLGYFGSAINISGSQRMRTMLISNFSQQLYFDNNSEAKDILEREIDIYREYMLALKFGDTALQNNDDNFLIANKYQELVTLIDEIATFHDITIYSKQLLNDPYINLENAGLFDKYIFFAEYLLNNPDSKESLEFIVTSSLELKNKIHGIVEAYEDQYRILVSALRRLSYSIICIAVIFTILGLILSKKIRDNEHHATYDFLTGLKTRRIMFENIKYKDSKKFSVLFIDLNKFKAVNDTFGHETGDEVLISIADRLQIVFSPVEVIRYGGDEFIILKEDSGDIKIENYIENVSKSVTKALNEPIVDSKNRLHYISFSMGVVTSNAQISSFKELISLADDLMYDSKSYHSRIIICNSKEDALTRQDRKNSIYRAIDKNMIIPYFQPVIDITGKILFYEILARWNYNETILDAYEFIPLLLRTGLIEDFDLYMLKSCNNLLNSSGSNLPEDIKFSININKKSIQNMENNNFLETLDDLILPNDRIIIELTEEIISDVTLKENVTRLMDRGFSIIVDDFSTSNNSIDSLRMDFIEYIKIDKTAIENLESNYQKSMLQELIYLMHTIDKKVILNGIETSEIYNTGIEMNFNGFQGNYLRPVTSEFH